jgi:hypothetical protein
MKSRTPASRDRVPQDPPDFSLVLGGPFVAWRGGSVGIWPQRSHEREGGIGKWTTGQPLHGRGRPSEGAQRGVTRRKLA